MDLKCRISTPLEAGTSILDAHRLPSYMTPALEYASKRLSSKGLHVTLVVARKDYQLPSVKTDSAVVPETRPVPTLPTPPRSPEFPEPIVCASRQNSLKSLSRSGTGREVGNADRPNTKQSQWRKVCGLPKKSSIASILDGTIGRRWPLTPNTPINAPKTPATPTTPATPASFVSAASLTTASSIAELPESQGPCVRMLYTNILSPKAQNFVSATLARATRKFDLDNALTTADPSSYNIPSIVLHGSILQNEVLFSSEGLTLLSMDHLYTFKSALSHYTTGRTEPGSEFRLEDAVDDLRRYVLSSAGGRRRMLKSVLVQAYDWLGQVNDYALSDVTEMYCRAYGGATGDCGVEDDLVRPSPRVASVGPAAKSGPLTQFAGGDSPLSPEPDVTLILQRSPQRAGEGLQSIIDAPTASEAPVPTDEADSLADGLKVAPKRVESPDKKPLSTRIHTKEQDSTTTTQPPQIVSQMQPQATLIKNPSPRASPKASLPTLRVQTSFTQPIKPKARRKETPVPAQQPLREKNKSKPASLDTTSVPLSAVCKPTDEDKETDISIEIHADDDPSNDEADLTDFEDADLTARPPPSATCGKTPVEPIWSGIDEILGNSGSRRARKGGMMLASSHQIRRSSSLVLQQDKAGPATPNGYDDISPITRGEWGFLMVSDPFRTKTAAVSCV